ncbi:hypothetical protein K431DRAFT_153653 [Polychaeton citri CBS 116435]|uniref:Uncharacterized protein n=1 Tax=Polychaeton citri CBS 116435 TaxID=1314669 RepID=A0A9P4PYT8_9PEZI|nr:hypothetical protein K431DRAFT_153653 [Polychaeton citri CBS 116435]
MFDDRGTRAVQVGSRADGRLPRREQRRARRCMALTRRPVGCLPILPSVDSPPRAQRQCYRSRCGTIEDWNSNGDGNGNMALLQRSGIHPPIHPRTGLPLSLAHSRTHPCNASIPQWPLVVFSFDRLAALARPQSPSPEAFQRFLSAHVCVFLPSLSVPQAPPKHNQFLLYLIIDFGRPLFSSQLTVQSLL